VGPGDAPLLLEPHPAATATMHAVKETDAAFRRFRKEGAREIFTRKP
jgi:hypothetical protein